VIESAICILLGILVAVEYTVLVAYQLGWIDGMTRRLKRLLGIEVSE
jgi:hypothetical protein